MKKKDLREATRLSPAVIAKMGRGEPVHLETLVRICRALHCRIDEVVEITPAGV
ncbi:MAG: helix-turn-helix transcriptional regulator [Clostridia bacterium]|nr:helix-turn-helix transcriptional regulator [Clostridia bacterium]MBR6290262.1 helix-turn-helix transcriptional regulator [Clostridia bacterium]